MNQNNNRNFIGKTYHGSGIKGKLFKYLPVEKNIEIFVGPIPKQEQLLCKSPTLFLWNYYGEQYSSSLCPENLEYNGSNKKSADAMKYVRLLAENNLKGEQDPDAQLNVVEHFGALSNLLKKKIQFSLNNNVVPYDMELLTEIAEDFFEETIDDTLIYMTPKEQFVYPSDDCSITIKPLKEKRLIVQSSLDYSKISLYSDIKQEAEFDSSRHDLDYIKSFTSARTLMFPPKANDDKFPPRLKEFTKNLIFLKDLINDDNEIARHNILDFLGVAYLGLGQQFLAGKITMDKAGHKDHIEFMRLLRDREFDYI